MCCFVFLQSVSSALSRSSRDIWRTRRNTSPAFGSKHFINSLTTYRLRHLIVKDLFLNLQQLPILPLSKGYCDCFGTIISYNQLVYFAESRQLRLNVAQLHAEQVSKSSYLIVEYNLGHLTLSVVANFKHGPYSSSNHYRVVEDSSEALDVGDCFQ